MSEKDDLAARAMPWLKLCGSCDAGLPMSCTCPTGDPRSVILELWRHMEAAESLLGRRESGDR